MQQATAKPHTPQTVVTHGYPAGGAQYTNEFLAMVRNSNPATAAFTLHCRGRGNAYRVTVQWAGPHSRAQHMRVSLAAPAAMLPAMPALACPPQQWQAYQRQHNRIAKQWAAPALAMLGLTGPLQYNQRAGCSCGCSPAFVWRGGSMYVGGRRVAWLTVAPLTGA